MRIAIVHSYYSSAQPSGENVVVDLQREALEKAGHTVALVSVSTDDLQSSVTYAPRSAVRVATGRGRSPLRRLRQFRPDIVHIHNLFPNYSTSWIQDWDGPTVATIHNYRPLCAAGTLFKDGGQCELCPAHGSMNAVRHQCYRESRLASLPLAIASRGAGSHDDVLAQATRLVFLSDRAAGTYSRLASALTADRMRVVPNFVRDPLDMGSVRRGREWVYSGRLTPDKGIQDLVRLWPDDVPLAIIGAGPDQGAIETAARGKLVTMVGLVSREEAVDRVSAAYGLVFPSRWQEPAPAVSYLDALASGTPVLAWPGNAVADDVAESGSGTVAEISGTRAAISTIDDNHANFSAAARAQFDARYSEHSWLTAIENVYQEAMQ